MRAFTKPTSTLGLQAYLSPLVPGSTVEAHLVLHCTDEAQLSRNSCLQLHSWHLHIFRSFTYVLCTLSNIPFSLSPDRLTHNRNTGWHSISDQDTPEFISLAGQLLICDTLPLADSHQYCLDQLASIHNHNTLNSHAYASNVSLASDCPQQVSVAI